MTEINNTSQNVMYTFRFTTSNQRLQLNQKQIDRIPYLSALVTHKDDLLSIQNSNDEYLLNPPIYYTWLMPVLYSIFFKKASNLFNELPEDDDILCTLQLFDYLSVNSFNPPLLKDKDLVLLNPVNNSNETRCAVYHRANLVEARNTAAEFLIAISNNVYDLLDIDAVDNIFTLVLTILSHADVFSSRFRHHTLTIVIECCLTFFPKKQQRQLLTTHQVTQKDTNLNSLMYLYDENNPLPSTFWSVFSWRGVYMCAEKNDISLSSAPSERVSYSLEDYRILFRSSVTFRMSFGDLEKWAHHLLETPEEVELKQKKIEAQLARSGYFRTSSKVANIDKFKHRSDPKAQKHR